MSSLAFISPALPLSRSHCHSSLVSNRSIHPRRVVPRAASNFPDKPLQNLSTYLFYTVTPLLLTDPLSALAQTTQSTSAVEQIDPTQITESDLDSSLTSRILGWTAFLLLVIASVSAVILSIDNFIKTREDKKNRQWVQDRIDRRPYPKNFWSPDEDTTFTADSRGATTGKPMNRETRRMEKRVRDKEEREKARREKLAQQRADAKADKEQSKD